MNHYLSLFVVLGLCFFVFSIKEITSELTVDFEFSGVAPTCCPVPPPPCGDGICEATEGCEDARYPCRLDCDCGSLCGDELCEDDEDCRNCPGDCGACAVCGNLICEMDGDPMEDCNTCPQDCSRCKICGDSICELDETCDTCSADCGVCPAGTVQGRIVDSVNGAPIAAATVQLYIDGVPYAPLTTDSEGYVIFHSVPSPYATFTIVAEDYYDAWTQVQVIEGFTNRFVRGMSPIIERGQWRVVLTWLDEPFDLDLTLFGPYDEEIYSHGVCNWEFIYKNDSLPWAGYTVGDDVDSLGPESILLLEVEEDKEDLEFWIHNYSGDRNDEKELMRNSTATVWVFNYLGQQGEWNIPRDAPLDATWWHVFDLSQGKRILNVNQYFTGSSAACGFEYCPYTPA